MKNRKSLIFKKSLYKKSVICLMLMLLLTSQNATLFSSVEHFVPLDPAGTNKLIFGKTVFDNAKSNFFLGAQTYTPVSVATTYVDPKTFAITRAATDNALTEIFGITPQTTSMPNPSPEAGNPVYESVPNPLYGQVILNLGLFSNIYPIVTWTQGSSSSTYNFVALILAPQDGSATITTTNTLCDAGGQPTQEIKALTGSNKYVFAAVSATGLNWNDPSTTDYNRGIAALTTTVTTAPATISQIPAPTINVPTNAPKAQIVDVRTNAKMISFSDAVSPTPGTIQALIGSDVDMYWDSGLSRLFIGLSGVKRDVPTNEGGCFSVLVGRIDTDKTSGKDIAFSLSPILSSPSKTQFTPDSTNFMIGFYYNTTGTNDITISANKVRVMHTSTGYNYLIVNCDVTESTPNTYSGVFALPLIGATKSDGTTPQDPKLIGTLAQVQPVNFYAAPTAPANMPQKNQVPVIVGGKTLPMGDLSDMFVRGDSVFICLKNLTDVQDAGIFQSTALFDKNGFIIAWTPWQRVMGDIQQVYGGGVDKFSNFYFLATENPTDPSKIDPNTIRITQWGTTENVNEIETITIPTTPTGTTPATNPKAEMNPDPNRNLSAVLSGIFPQDQCGALQIINFDEKTPGFNPNFSMMVAIGYNSVALIQTMKAGVPVTKFETSGTNQNVFVFKNDALNAIAPLCFVEVARRPADPSTPDVYANAGWLFVGGYKGVAVLSQNDGSGWDSNTGLDNLAKATPPDTTPTFPGTGYTFKQLTPSNGGDFDNVRKLASLISADTQKLFIQTRDNLYAIAQDANKFSNSPEALNEQKLLNNLPEDLKFTDLLIIPNSDDPTATQSNKFTFLLGSTSGLFVGSNYDKINGKIDIINPYPGDPVLQLCYISQTKGLNSTKGNLYALSANFLSSTGKVNRYSVNGSLPTLANRINPLGTSPFIDLYNFRGDFITDGAFGFSMIARGPSNNFLTDLYQIAQTQIETGSIDSLLGLKGSNWYIGVISRNTASGSWMVPGDWGIRVNE